MQKQRKKKKKKEDCLCEKKSRRVVCVCGLAFRLLFIHRSPIHTQFGLVALLSIPHRSYRMILVCCYPVKGAVYYIKDICLCLCVQTFSSLDRGF